MTDKNLKIRVILSYVHTLLDEADNLTKEGKGTSIIDSEDDKKYFLENGTILKKYCEDNGCTKKHIEKLNFIQQNMFQRATRYYNETIKVYHTTFKDRHIPLLFAILVFERLQGQGYLKVDCDYTNLLKIMKESDHLTKEERPSKFTKDKIATVHTEIVSYDKCMDLLFNKIYAMKMSIKSKKKRK